MHHIHGLRSGWLALVLLGFYGPLVVWCFAMAFKRRR